MKVWIKFFALGLLFSSMPCFAADLKSAKITQVVNQVRLLPPGSDAVSADVGSTLSGSTAIATGRRSRAELVFNDSTLMRIGSSTTFSISNKKREVELQSGSLLLQTPTGGGNGVNVRAGGVTAAITGSLGLASLSRPTDRKLKDSEWFFKFISIHGDMHVVLPGGRVINLRPFQMLFLRLDNDGKIIGEPIISTIDGNRLVKTSDLVKRFSDQSRLRLFPIQQRLLAQFDEKRKNNWTVVATDSHNRVPGLFRKLTVGVNALIKPRVNNPIPPMKHPYPYPERTISSGF